MRLQHKLLHMFYSNTEILITREEIVSEENKKIGDDLVSGVSSIGGIIGAVPKVADRTRTETRITKTFERNTNPSSR